MASIALTIVVCIVIALVIQYLFKYYKQVKLTLTQPNPGFPLPLLGHSLLFYNVNRENMLERFLSFCHLHNRRFFSLIGQQTVVWFFHPENAEEILSSNTLITKGDLYESLIPWLGTGLLLSTHEKWRHRRKLLTPAFHFKILEDSLKVFNRQSTVCTDVLIEDSKNGEEIVDLFPYMTRCTLDIILETAMGRTLDVQNNKESKYAQAIQDMVHIVQQRQLIPWFHYDFLYQFSSMKKDQDKCLTLLHDFTKNVIRDKRAEIQDHETNQTTHKGPIAFLDLLLSVTLPDGSKLTNSDVQEEVDTFMFEGHDTTACALSWTLFLLGLHPDIQQKAYEEQVAIFGDDPDADVSNEHLSKMKYLESCIKESLRLYPSVPIIGRKLEKDTVIDGVPLPAGSTALVFVHLLHRNPEVWPQPEKFDPSRFSDQSASRHPFAYVPFSAGPRNCIGQKFALMEEKTVLSKLIRKLKFESLDKVEEVKPVIEVITRPFEGIRSKITLRQ